jgi:hypothetical protein
VRRQRRRLRDAAGHSDAAYDHRIIPLIRQIIRMDRRVLQRIGRLDLDASAAERAQLTDRRRKGGKAMRPFTGFVRAQRLHVELDIRPGHIGAGAREDRDLTRGQRKRAGPRQEVLHADPQFVQRTVDLVVQVRSRVLNTSLT